MKRLCTILLVLMVGINVFGQVSTDSLQFQKIVQVAKAAKWSHLSAGERVAAFGSYFLGTPYVAYTLEASGPERLQVNLRAMDCTTLVENALALSNTIISSHPDFATFQKYLTAIRYRNGQLAGYPSRLHYASDWLADNVRKGYLHLPKLPEMLDFRPRVDYMSTHPSAYAALKADSTLLPAIVSMEAAVNALSFYFLPKERLTEKAAGIKNGDIIAITTDFPGLDIAHLGIAIRQKGKVYLLHASTTGKKVLVTESPLSVYLAGIKKHSGVIVARPQ